MSIVETQMKLIKQKITQQELQRGVYPSISAIEDQMRKRFSDKIQGLPMFKYRPIVKHTVSSMDSYNAMLNEIEEDLIVAFEETKAINNIMMAMGNYYEANRTRVNQELKKLEQKTDILSIRATSHANRDLVGDTLNDFSKIEFKGDTDRNIPATTAFIDLRHSEATLQKIANMTTKHDLSKADASFTSLTEGTKVIHLAGIQSAFVDYVQESWRSIVTSDKGDGVIAEIKIECPEAIYGSMVTIDMQNAKPTLVTLYLSDDGESYTEYETRRVSTNYQWMFPRRLVKFIRFKLEKKEEDLINGMVYEYIFGAKSIELKDDMYTQRATFVSKALPIHNHDAIDYIHLETDDHVPPETQIHYYVGLDYGNNPIEWQEITKNNPIPMRMIQTVNMEIDSHTDGYGALKYTNFGQNFYSIGKLDQTPLNRSTSLLMGRNMWVKETIAAGFVDSGETVYTTSIRDWIRAGSPPKQYMNIDQYADILQKDTFQRYTTYVFIEDAKDATILQGEISTDNEASFALYVNNALIKSINNVFHMTFRTGWNKIEVLTYARETNQEIRLGIYLREISHLIYANNQSLQEVSLYDLLNNTSIRLHNRFAIDEENNIIVNCNPKDLDIRKHGIEYSLSYRYSTSDKKNHAIRLMAILSKESEQASVSPRLKDYRLIIE